MTSNSSEEVANGMKKETDNQARRGAEQVRSLDKRSYERGE